MGLKKEHARTEAMGDGARASRGVHTRFPGVIARSRPLAPGWGAATAGASLLVQRRCQNHTRQAISLMRMNPCPAPCLGAVFNKDAGRGGSPRAENPSSKGQQTASEKGRSHASKAIA